MTVHILPPPPGGTQLRGPHLRSGASLVLAEVTFVLVPLCLRGAPVLQATVPLCRGAFLPPHRGETEHGANLTAAVQSWCHALTSALQEVCCGAGAEYSELQLPVDGVETLAVPSSQS